MRENDIIAVAENADMIVAGYAFTAREDGFISVLNLKTPFTAMLLNPAGEMLETNMDGIEQQLVLKYWKRNAQFMEAKDA